MKTDPVHDIEAYAELAAALADPAANRAALLSAHGLDEEAWETLDNAWQARISADDDAHGNDLSPLLSAYAEAFARAQRVRQNGSILTFERFLEVVRALRHGGDVAKTLERFGTTFSGFLASQKHWMDQLLKDSELAERWRRAMR